MFWKLSGREFEHLSNAGTKRAQKRLVRSGVVPGLLAYAGKLAVGWIAVEPRSQYPRLARSRMLKPVDDLPVWSITCFFTRREFRGQGVSLALLRAAISHVRNHAGKIVEGYPVESGAGRLPGGSAYTGLVSAFRKAGFMEVAWGSAKRRIYRYEIGPRETS